MPLGTEKVRFKHEVFAARAASGDPYTRITVGSNLTLVVKTDAGNVDKTVVVTSVEDEGKTIGWNSEASLALNVSTENVVRVHLKHTKSGTC